MPRVDNTQVELDELLDRLMQYSYDYGSGNIPTSENPPLLIARQTKQAITSLMKELVAEAKPAKYSSGEYILNVDGIGEVDGHEGHNQAIDQFEQNLLKALEKV